MIELVEDVKALQDLVGTCCSSATDLTCAFWRIRCDCCMENAWQSKLTMDTRTIVYQIGLLQLSAHPSRWIYYIYIQNLVPTCATRNSTLVTFPLGALQLCYGTAKMSELNTGSGSEDPRSWSRQMNMQWLHSPKFLNSQRPNSSKNEPNSEANQQLFLRPHFHWLMLVDRDPHP
jgi:hypothetical protein